MTTVLITLWNPLAAGAPTMAVQFTIGLREAGHDVVVVHGPRAASTATDVLDDLRGAGATVVPLRPFGARTLLANLRTALAVADEHDCRAVLSFQQADRLLGALVARRRSLPFVVHCGLAPIMRGPSVARWVKGRLQRWALSRADQVVCPSPVVTAAVVDGFGVRPERAPVLYNGIDTAAVASRAAHVDREAGTTLRLLSIGRTQWEKGHDVALRALIERAAQLPDWSYRIVGTRTGGGSDEHDALVGALVAAPEVAGRVSLPGWSGDVHAELGRTDVYLHPSRAEGWSLAVCEALAAGTVAVLTDCAGRPPGFEDGVHGWIVPSGDVAAFGDALVTAMRLAPVERERIGAAAAQFAAAHFDIGPCRRRMVAWIEELVAARGGA